MCKNLSAVALVLKDVQHGATAPSGVSLLGGTAQICQQFCDLRGCIAIQVGEKDEPDCLGLIFVDNKVPVLILIISQQRRGEKNTMRKPHFIRTVHACAFCV